MSVVTMDRIPPQGKWSPLVAAEVWGLSSNLVPSLFVRMCYVDVSIRLVEISSESGGLGNAFGEFREGAPA